MNKKLNETAKFGQDGDISFNDSIFENTLKDNDVMQYLRKVNECPLCDKKNIKDFFEHMGEDHVATTCVTIIKKMEEKMRPFCQLCKELFILRNMTVIQSQTIPPNKDEIRRYKNITNEMKRNFEDCLYDEIQKLFTFIFFDFFF